MGRNPLLVGLVDMDSTAAHFHYDLDFVFPKAAIAPYDCCVSSADFVPLVEANRGVPICAGHNISRPSNLPNYMKGLKYLNRPCGLTLAGIVPLSTLHVTPSGSSTPSLASLGAR
ncbi:hypothetical protein AURDEDRAFT_165706 [Auricularia subglabra TFB-10046 SS5]|nr:hypothetical protein AURDEDRAFT_165706 [Auricularia subglabra TFB-10046 SS5]